MGWMCRDVSLEGDEPRACARIVAESKNYYCEIHREWTSEALMCDLVAARANLCCGLAFPLQIERRGDVVWLELDTQTLTARVSRGAASCEQIQTFINLLGEFSIADGPFRSAAEGMEMSRKECERIRADLTTRTISVTPFGARLRVHAQTRVLEFLSECAVGNARIPVWKILPPMFVNWLGMDTWCAQAPPRLDRILKRDAIAPRARSLHSFTSEGDAPPDYTPPRPESLNSFSRSSPHFYTPPNSQEGASNGHEYPHSEIPIHMPSIQDDDARDPELMIFGSRPMARGIPTERRREDHLNESSNAKTKNKKQKSPTERDILGSKSDSSSKSKRSSAQSIPGARSAETTRGARDGVFLVGYSPEEGAISSDVKNPEQIARAFESGSGGVCESVNRSISLNAFRLSPNVDTGSMTREFSKLGL